MGIPYALFLLANHSVGTWHAACLEILTQEARDHVDHADTVDQLATTGTHMFLSMGIKKNIYQNTVNK
jgi:hypothetical protein